MDLNTLWFLILGGLLAGYLVLDGFDLGIGVIHLFTVDGKHRDHLLALIGAYWDGNEVWLIIAGGVLFAVFPGAYAALLSSFYPHFVLLLLAFIVRGLAIDLRNKHAAAAWRRFWDICFGVGSLAVIALVGIVGANLASGVPTDNEGVIRVSTPDSLRPSALLAAALAVAVLTMHGALYAAARTPQARQDYFTKWTVAAWGLALGLVVPAVVLNINLTGATAARSHSTLFATVATLLVLTVLSIPWALRRGRHGYALFGSCLLLAELLAGLAMLLYPRLIRSTSDDAHSVTIYSAAATQPTMVIMLVILAMTLPLAIGYMVFVRFVLRRQSDQQRYSGPATEIPAMTERTE